MNFDIFFQENETFLDSNDFKIWKLCRKRNKLWHLFYTFFH